MNWFWWLSSGLVLGATMGVFVMVVLEQSASDRQAARRAKQRALLGLPDRPPARRDAAGSARVTTANYSDRRPDSTMQM